MPELTFWYEFASTYSYPAAMRIEDLAAARGVKLRWQPFLLGPIFASQGWADSPFNLYDAKGRYMWRDLERICAGEGLPLRLPPVRFPQNGLKAARIALIAAEEGWAPAFTRAVYAANFAEQKDIADTATLAEILTGLEQNPEAVMQRAFADANKAALKDATQDAIDRGIFGAPSFTVAAGEQTELFWGNDRLEAALAFACASAPGNAGGAP